MLEKCSEILQKVTDNILSHQFWLDDVIIGIRCLIVLEMKIIFILSKQRRL